MQEIKHQDPAECDIFTMLIRLIRLVRLIRASSGFVVDMRKNIALIAKIGL